jgi:saccharopepsin
MIHFVTILLSLDLFLVAYSSKITVPVSRPSGRNRLKNVNDARSKLQSMAATNDKTNSTSLRNYGDIYYTAKIKIGTGQIFSVDLDTGSSDLWLRGSSCHSIDGSCGDRAEKSKQTGVNVNHPAVQATGKNFSIVYGSGAVVGNVYKTTVSIQGINVTMNMGLSDSELGFNSVNTDGLLGLGFPKLNKIQGGNFIESAGCKGLEKIFGFYFSNTANGDEGEFTFGGYDSTKFKGNITWLPVTKKSYWSFSTDGWTYQIGKASGKLSGTYIADTGTSLILLPDTMADEINAEIGAKVNLTDGDHYLDCSVAKTGPDLEFTFGGGSFKIPASICK